MDRRIFPHNWRVYVPLVIVYVILVLLLPKEGKFRYHYQKGRPWMYETLISPMDFPILKTDQELMSEMEEKSSHIIPYYKLDESVRKSVNQMIYGLDLSGSGLDNPGLVSLFDQVYENGLVSELTPEETRNGVIIIQKDRRAVEVTVASVYDVRRAATFIRSSLEDMLGETAGDSLFTVLDLDTYIVPNLKFDQASTDMLHKEAASYISPTKGVVYTGQLIVSEGEIVTAEIEQLLDSFKAEYLASMGFSDSTLWVVAGNAILLLVSLFILFLTILFVDRSIFSEFSRYYFVLTLFALCTVVTELLTGRPGNILLMVPYPVFALYMMSFFRKGVLVPIYAAMLLPMLVIVPEGLELFYLNIAAGMAAVISFSRFSRGWLQFVNALFIFLTLLVSYMAFSLVRSGSVADFRDYADVFYFGLASLFCVAAYPLVFLFEKIFGLVSNQRLRDLADTNNPVLRDMAEKAPGTFQHALQVMNLADACARAIGANVRLVRTGALYHDVGKTANPQCFIENAAPGVNYHAGLTPAESARDIIKHVDDGMALARKHKVPAVVSDFILSHHGTSRTEYFYNVYVNGGGDPADSALFEYHGFKPRTKEQAIVMFADAVEAASRSLKDYSEKSISELVDRIVKMKMDDGQLAEADISLKEIAAVKSTLVGYLGQINHARIAYPKRQER